MYTIQCPTFAIDFRYLELMTVKISSHRRDLKIIVLRPLARRLRHPIVHLTQRYSSTTPMFPSPAPKLPVVAPRVQKESIEGEVRVLYPPIEAWMTGRLKVDDTHDLYYEQVRLDVPSPLSSFYFPLPACDQKWSPFIYKAERIRTNDEVNIPFTHSLATPTVSL